MKNEQNKKPRERKTTVRIPKQVSALPSFFHQWGGTALTTINLRVFYPWYLHDEYIDVTDEVAEALRAGTRYEISYRRRVTRNKAQYSLDCDDGIEYSAYLHTPTPEEVLIRKELRCFLQNALNSLPEIQSHRVYACIIEDRSYAEVARAEGVNESAVRHSVVCGLKNMKKYLRKCL